MVHETIKQILLGTAPASNTIPSRFLTAGDGWAIDINCPVEVIVRDNYGNEARFDEDFGIINTIPGLSFELLGDSKHFFVNHDTTVEFIINGYDTGSMNIYFTKYDGSPVNGIALHDLVITDNTNVNFNFSGSIEDASTVLVQYDELGNGNIQSLYPDTLFNPAEPPRYDENGNEPNPPGDDIPHHEIDITLSGTIGKNDWYTSDVNISLSTSIEVLVEEPEEGEGNEEEGEQPAAPEPKEPVISYSLNDGGEMGYSGNITVSQDGYHTLHVYVRDDEGTLLGQASKSFKLDKTKPELSNQVAAVQGENGWLISDAQISIGSSDETSKLARVSYNYNGRGLQTYAGHFNETNEGHHTVYSEAEDNAGNVQTLTTPFKIDKTKPVIADVYLQDEYYWGEYFPIQFNTHDDISGVASINATINGKPVTNGSSYLFTEPGWHTYRIEVKDYAGWKAVYETEFEVYIPATISFRPKNLMLDHGEPGMATTFIQLPEPFPLEHIIHSSVELNEHNIHIQDPQYGFVKNPIGYDDEEADFGVNDYYMLKYNRGTLIDVIEPMEPVRDSGNPNAPDWSHTTIALFGKWGEYHFKGYDSFIVSNKRYNPPPDVTKPEFSSQPVHNQTNVSVEATPVITFSEPIMLNNSLELTDQKC